MHTHKNPIVVVLLGFHALCRPKLKGLECDWVMVSKWRAQTPAGTSQTGLELVSGLKQYCCKGMWCR